jgi:hypothetical protein
MIYYNAPHEVRDEDKLAAMIAVLENGGTLPPVVVLGYDAFTGSHRLAAWRACEIDANVIELSDDDYKAAMTEIGLDWESDTVYDYNQFCDALYNVTTDDAVKAAIEDQRD